MAAYGNMDAAVRGLISDIRPRTILTKAPQNDFNFGDPALGYIGDENAVYNYYADTATVVYDADFVSLNSIAFSVNGVAITPVVFDTDHDTTVAALVAAVDALTGVDCILDTSDTDSRTLLVRTKGATITTLSTVTLGASQATATYTYSSDQVFLGVVVFSQKETGQYLASEDDAMPVMESGSIWVQAAAAVDALDDAFVNTTDATKFSESGFATNGKFETSGATDALVRLQVTGKYKPNAEIAW
jgi:hypothetical protein